MRVAIAQLNLLVGDVAGNVARMLAAAAEARDRHGAALVVFPELTLTGYPPEDLLLHAGLRKRVAEAENRLRTGITGIGLLYGTPEWQGEACYNVAVLVEDGRELGRYRKQALPNYAVFDEKRYFEPGSEDCVVDFHGRKLGITICEDLWVDGPGERAVAAGADVLLNLSASPFRIGHPEYRERDVFGPRARSNGVPLLCANLVGGQDELVFDGSSVLVGADGNVTARLPSFEESVVAVDVDGGGPLADVLDEEACIWRALKLGTRDYIDKNGFQGVVLGLSGGVDSGLCASLAVDALGADRVHTVMMPSRHTAAMSVEDAAELAATLGVDHREIGIEPAFGAFLQSLSASFGDAPADTAEQNLQARIRGTLLMALSNKFGWLVLLTGNKSEFAVGYSTLYGDMAGGFAPLKDLSKTTVYRLAHWRGGLPQRMLDRAPSAELAPGQLDEDTLPPYEVLDRIISELVELERSPEQLVADGFDPEQVERVVGMIRANEYKRRQSAPGIRVTGRAFGRDRRYPITSGYK